MSQLQLLRIILFLYLGTERVDDGSMNGTFGRKANINFRPKQMKPANSFRSIVELRSQRSFEHKIESYECQ